MDVKRLGTTSSVVSASLPGVNPPASPTSAFGVTGSPSTCVNASWTASREARSTPIAWTFSRSLERVEPLRWPVERDHRAPTREELLHHRVPERARGTRHDHCVHARHPARCRHDAGTGRDIGVALSAVAAHVLPRGLAQRRELEHLSAPRRHHRDQRLLLLVAAAGELAAWAGETPDDFVFAVKGPRFVTHMKQLRDVATPVANFLASGVLALGPKLGPVLWQLPPRMRFDADRVAALPGAAAAHDRAPRPGSPSSTTSASTGRALTATDADRPLRHAVEPRHESFRDPAFAALLRATASRS